MLPARALVAGRACRCSVAPAHAVDSAAAPRHPTTRASEPLILLQLHLFEGGLEAMDNAPAAFREPTKGAPKAHPYNLFHGGSHGTALLTRCLETTPEAA